MKMKIKYFFLAVSSLSLILILSSCSTLDKYDPGFIERNQNNQNLKKLEIGMTKYQVVQIMGNPLVDEKYNKPNVWFYYTDWDWADCARTKMECTPLVFQDGVLVGKGRAYYWDYLHKDWKFNDKEALNYDLSKE